MLRKHQKRTSANIDPESRELGAVDLTPYGKPAFGHLPTGLGKPAAGFPQPHSLDDDETNFLRFGLDSL